MYTHRHTCTHTDRRTQDTQTKHKDTSIDTDRQRHRSECVSDRMNDWSFSLSASVFFTANKIETQGKNSAHRIFAKGDMVTSLPLSPMGFSHSSKGLYLRPGDFNFSVGLVLG